VRAFADWVLVLGWGLNVLALGWIALLLVRVLTGWLAPAASGRARAGAWAAAAIDAPVNAVRRLVPTVYRGVDLAPWLTVLLLVLIKTFLFRALVYWGMLHRA
jgi:uncharacterized protein YggT (Ycf19 family)